MHSKGATTKQAMIQETKRKTKKTQKKKLPNVSA